MKDNIITEEHREAYKNILGPCNSKQTEFQAQAFYAHIIKDYLKNGMKATEIGVYQGMSAIFFAMKIKEALLNDIEFYAIDHFKGSAEHQPGGSLGVDQLREDPDFLYNTCMKNIDACGVNDYIKVLRKDSVSASQLFSDNYFDFLFIDAGHDYDSVKSDLDAWWPKLKMGGIISGDDYDSCWGGVVKAVNEKFKKETINIWKETLPHNTWYLTKV